MRCSWHPQCPGAARCLSASSPRACPSAPSRSSDWAPAASFAPPLPPRGPAAPPRAQPPFLPTRGAPAEEATEILCPLTGSPWGLDVWTPLSRVRPTRLPPPAQCAHSGTPHSSLFILRGFPPVISSSVSCPPRTEVSQLLFPFQGRPSLLRSAPGSRARQRPAWEGRSRLHLESDGVILGSGRWEWWEIKQIRFMSSQARFSPSFINSPFFMMLQGSLFNGFMEGPRGPRP